MHSTLLLTVCIGFMLSLPLGREAFAQDTTFFHRIYLRDKGTPARVLLPGDLFYTRATAHLTVRALERRAKVLPADSLISTDDLPIVPEYLQSIRATGAEIAQTSRWFNTVMIRADSLTLLRVLALPFIDSVQLQRVVYTHDPHRDKVASPFLPLPFSHSESSPVGCITTRYGASEVQNTQIELDVAHRMGIAGENVLVGVLDAGFHWRDHVALKHLNVLGEYDFVFGDSNAANTPGQDQVELNPEYHGTMVTSMIGAFWDGRLIGGAPHASFIFAKTEDVRSERHIEEDNFVAGLEWMESQGVDVTNTSLGYTDFDAPERSHPYSELNGRTAFASQGVNHAVRLGVVCVVAAGNDAQKFYHYIGVPAEADSAIAVAAVDSAGVIAGFSSRGFAGHERIKPDVAALGIRVFGADPKTDSLISSGPGTSFATPMVTGAVAVLLSAAPELTPYQIRTLLSHTASRADQPDTVYGHGIINVGAALDELSKSRPIIGFPSVTLTGGMLSIIAATEYNGPGTSDNIREPYLTLVLKSPVTGATESYELPQPTHGYASWVVPAELNGLALSGNDSLELEFHWSTNSMLLRRADVVLTSTVAYPRSFVCTTNEEFDSTGGIATVVPNPFRDRTVITFELVNPARSVELAIYDALGRKVARPLHDVDLSAGLHSVTFDATGLPAGAYFYQLRIDGSVLNATSDNASRGLMVHIP